MQPQNNYNEEDIKFLSNKIMTNIDMDSMAEEISKKNNVDKMILNAAKKYKPWMYFCGLNGAHVKKYYTLKTFNSGDKTFTWDIENPVNVDINIFDDMSTTKNNAIAIPSKAERMYIIDLSTITHLDRSGYYAPIFLCRRGYIPYSVSSAKPVFNFRLTIHGIMPSPDGYSEYQERGYEMHLYVRNDTDEEQTLHFGHLQLCVMCLKNDLRNASYSDGTGFYGTIRED